MRTVARLAPVVLFATLFDCTSFPAIPSGTCGNGVVDVGEDCDSFPVSGVACRPPTAPSHACRLDCSAGGACPAGWGCGADDVCRQSSGAFVRQASPIAAGAWRIDTGDFDGDRRADLLSREPIDPGGQSNVRLHFFDGNATLAKTLLVPPSLAWPHVFDVNGDQRSDIVFTSFNVTSIGGVGTLLGQSDRTLSPVAYPTVTFATSARAIPVPDFQPGAASFVFLVKDPFLGLIGTNLDGSTAKLTATPDGPDALAGELTTGRIFEDRGQFPCDEVLLAYPKATEVLLFPICKRSGADVVLNEGGAFVHVRLTAGATVDRGARFGDVNGDGHLDVMIGVVEGSPPVRKTHVAYGDGTTQLRSDPKGPADGTAAIFRLTTQQLGETYEPELPLAVADVNGDRVPDFVLPTYVLSSVRAGGAPDGGAPDGGAPATSYFVAAQKARGAWTQAIIADFNANGFADVVAASSTTLDVDFYNGTGLGIFSHFSLATNGPVSHVAAGDLDGDFLPDIALSQTVTGGDELAIAYGRAAAPPDAPAFVGRFERIVETFAFNSGRPLDDLAVLSRPLDTKAAPSSAFSVLAGTGDREPLALFSLTKPRVNTGLPFNAVPGRFRNDGSVDIVAFAEDSDGAAHRLWFMKSVGGIVAGGTPQFLPAIDGPKLSDLVQPILSTPDTSGVTVLSAQGDLDGDGTPELVVFTPLGPGFDGARSELTIAKAHPGDPVPFEVRDPIAIDTQATQEGQLALFDVDGDGALDIVLLTGADGGGALTVYFNDHAGQFDVKRSAVISAKDEVATGFAFVGIGAREPTALAYVTQTTVVLAHLTAGDRTGARRDKIAATRSATGIVAADVDGDGVQDLAIAESGNLVILRGQAVLP